MLHRMSPLNTALLPLFFFIRRLRKLESICLSIVLSHILCISLLLDGRCRYFFPISALLLALLFSLAQRVSPKLGLSKIVKTVTLLSLLLAIAANGVQNLKEGLYLLDQKRGKTSRHEYLESTLVYASDYFWMNRKIKRRDARIFILGESQIFLLDHDCAFTFHAQLILPSEVLDISKLEDNPKGVFKKLSDQGFTHVYYMNERMEKRRVDGKRFMALVEKEGRVAHRSARGVIYEIAPE